MNERESKLKAIENYLTFYFELMVDEGQMEATAMRPHDIEYMAQKLVGVIEQVEVDREYAR